MKSSGISGTVSNNALAAAHMWVSVVHMNSE
jgi:hypothetical protein